MFEKLYSGDLHVPLLGDFVVDFRSPTRGRWWLDAAVGRRSVELFAGPTHLIWDVNSRGCALLAFFLGWIIDPPLIMLAAIG